MGVYIYFYSVILACSVSMHQLSEAVNTDFSTARMKFTLLDEIYKNPNTLPTSIGIKQGIICRAEDNIYKSKMGVSFRLGNLNYVNQIERTKN